MLRYLAIAWDVRSRAQMETATGLLRRAAHSFPEWAGAYREEGLTVLFNGCTPGATRGYMLARAAGVIVGTLFSRDNDAQTASFRKQADLEDSETEAVLCSSGRSLMDSHWGNYVAFLKDPESAVIRVIKDPTGDLPCFFTLHCGVAVFYSYVPDCIALGFSNFTANWEYVVARLATGPFHNQSGINEIEELHRGHCAELEGGAVSFRQYWNPLDIARQPPIEDFNQAAEALRLTTLSCIRAWSDCYPNALHLLSGGFDSSVVLAGMAGSHPAPRITSLTLYVPNGVSDERPWARIAAAAANCRHIEHPRDPTIDLRGIMNVTPSAGIECLSVFLEMGPILRQLARAASAPAVFSGAAGDFTFGSHVGAFAAFEYLSRHGPGSRLFEVASDLAHITNTSVWSVLRKALAARMSANERELHASKHEAGFQLLRSDLSRQAITHKRHPHPWFAAEDRVPWAVINLVGALVATPSFYNPLSNPDAADPEPVAPLQSQPLIELCLRIPAYLVIHGGRDRALARQAFRNHVNSRIVNRIWKDRSPRFFAELIFNNLAHVRERLLDGALVKERLLDRAALERALSGQVTAGKQYAVEVLDYLCAEAWLDSWRTTARLSRSAAARRPPGSIPPDDIGDAAKHDKSSDRRGVRGVEMNTG